jgi:phytol kinase
MLLAAVAVLLLLTALAAASGQPAPSPALCLVVAVLATALEQWSVYGVDNLSVPVVTGVLWQHWSS